MTRPRVIAACSLIVGSVAAWLLYSLGDPGSGSSTVKVQPAVEVDVEPSAARPEMVGRVGGHNTPAPPEQLGAQARFEVTVVRAEDRVPLEGARIRVVLESWSGAPMADAVEVQSDAEGRALLQFEAPPESELWVRLAIWHEGRATRVHRLPLGLGIAVMELRAAARLAGLVVDDGGDPVGDVDLVLHRLEDPSWRLQDQDPGRRYLTATSDDAGRFTIEAVEGGRPYRLGLATPDLVLSSSRILRGGIPVTGGQESIRVPVTRLLGVRLKLLDDGSGRPVPGGHPEIRVLTPGYSVPPGRHWVRTSHGSDEVWLRRVDPRTGVVVVPLFHSMGKARDEEPILLVTADGFEPAAARVRPDVLARVAGGRAFEVRLSSEHGLPCGTVDVQIPEPDDLPVHLWEPQDRVLTYRVLGEKDARAAMGWRNGDRTWRFPSVVSGDIDLLTVSGSGQSQLGSRISLRSGEIVRVSAPPLQRTGVVFDLQTKVGEPLVDVHDIVCLCSDRRRPSALLPIAFPLQTDVQGQTAFTLISLSPGTYRFIVKLSGFNELRTREYSIAQGEVVRVDGVLNRQGE